MLRPSRDNRVYYGWYIVGVAFLGHFLATGTGLYVFNAFINPLTEIRGWSRTAINLAPLIGYPVGLFASLILGTLVVRVGPRILMALGALVGSSAFVLMGRVEDIWLFYLMFLILSVADGAISGVVANTAVSNWFVSRRGAALGISSVGISLSGVILPYAALEILTQTTLELAFFWIGMMVLVLAPMAWIVVRNRPEDHGLLPDGIPASHGRGEDRSGAEGRRPLETVASTEPLEQRPWTFSGLVRTPAFWKLGAAYALVGMCVGSVMFQLAPRFSDIGFDEHKAMLMMSLTALMGCIGKFVWGMLCDRFEPKRVVSAQMAATGLGIALALAPPTLFALLLFIVFFGFSMGGLMSTHPIITADLFGRQSFATAYKYLGIFFLFEGAGYLLMGRSYDLTGSYNPAYALYVITNFLAASLIVSIKRPQVAS